MLTETTLAGQLPVLVAEYQRLAAAIAKAGPAPSEERAGRLRDMGNIARVAERTAKVLGQELPDWAAMRLLAGLDS